MRQTMALTPVRILIRAAMAIRIITARHKVRTQARTLIRIEHQARGVRAARRRPQTNEPAEHETAGGEL
jgi:hypothetical protein